jgi:hypothetical protein
MSDSSIFRAVAHCFRTVSLVVVDLVRLAFLAARSHRSLAAENLFLRKQLALFQERKVKPRRADDATRWLMATLSQMFQWPGCAGECQAGYAHPLAPQRLPALLALAVEIDGETTLAQESSAPDPGDGRGESDWGEERIANELQLKLGIRVSPRTVEKYLRSGGPRRPPDPKAAWLTFIHNHAKVIVACDFFVVVTASFRTLYVFVIMELGTRRILHQNVTAHPTRMDPATISRGASGRASLSIRDPRPG